MGAYITLHKYDNKLYEFSPIKNKEKPASGQNKVRADIFSGSLAVCLFASASRLRTASVGQARRGGRKGGLVFALPPAEPRRNFGSDIFKQTPPVGKSEVWLARYAGSPADFRFKIKFFAFVPQSGTPEAGFSKF